MDGSVLAIASSYQFEEGDLANVPEDSVFVRKVSDQETKPKWTVSDWLSSVV